jgi:hypothetical protein
VESSAVPLVWSMVRRAYDTTIGMTIEIETMTATTDMINGSSFCAGTVVATALSCHQSRSRFQRQKWGWARDSRNRQVPHRPLHFFLFGKQLPEHLSFGLIGLDRKQFMEMNDILAAYELLDALVCCSMGKIHRKRLCAVKFRGESVCVTSLGGMQRTGKIAQQQPRETTHAELGESVVL